MNPISPTNGQPVGENQAFFDELTDELTAMWSQITESIETTGAIFNSWVTNTPITNFNEFEEENVWVYDVFEPVFLRLDRQTSYSALFVCKGWARDGIDLLIRIQQVKKEKWIAILPKDPALLLGAAEDFTTSKNLKELQEKSQEGATNSHLKSCLLDQLKVLQALSIEKSFGYYEQSLISVEIIEKASLSLIGRDSDKISTYKRELERAKNIIAEEWERLLSLRETSALLTVMIKFNGLLPPDYLAHMQDHISKVQNPAVLLKLFDPIAQICCRVNTQFVQAECRMAVYRRLVNMGQLEKAIAYAQKNNSTLISLCKAFSGPTGGQRSQKTRF